MYAEERRQEAIEARVAEHRRTEAGENPGLACEIEDMMAEARRQNKKWGVQNHDDGTWALIFLEEIGEAAQEMLVEKFAPEQHRRENAAEDGDAELIQTAAVVLQWAKSRRRQRARKEQA